MAHKYSHSSWKDECTYRGLARTEESRVLQAESPDILPNFDSVFVDEPTQPQYLAWLRSLPVAASSLPALIGLHAAAIVSIHLADAFDAAADAAAMLLPMLLAMLLLSHCR